MHYFLLFSLLLGFNFDAHSQVYKWVDQDGNIQYTDQHLVLLRMKKN